MELSLATSILILLSNILGYKGARQADDVHEQHGRNYYLAVVRHPTKGGEAFPALR